MSRELEEERKQSAALQRMLDEYKDENLRLRMALRAREEKDPWIWIGDGTDDLESMSNQMIVTIFAGDLRRLLQERKSYGKRS